MKTTKKLLASAVAASLVGAMTVPAHADIELGEGLSVTGFIDMSFYSVDDDATDETSHDFGIDQVETDFLYTGKDGITAQVDIEYSQDENGDETTFVEQAFITKDFGGGLSVTAGRFLSYTGWETEEPTGLYQYSGTGYGGAFYGGYQQGVSAYYDTESVDFMFSVVNDAFDPNESDNEKLAFEAGVALSPVEGLTAKLFYVSDDEIDLINVWASYEVSGWTLAAEYNMGDYGSAGVDMDFGSLVEEGDGYLLMANYAWSDFGITARYHDWSTEDTAGATNHENSAITLAPSYAVSDNLLLVAEIRLDETDDEDSTAIALEALFTF
ncbi:MAG: porin [Agarilytica sp.]